MQSFYWHDYETVGADPATDWPAQFAGIRTDADLNEIGEPLNIYCQLPADRLPHPEACMVTGLDPYTVNERGVVEPEFIKKIHYELMQPGTCTVGYNSIRFDDEVTRHSLYRNFYDPYAREWQNGNSRWDLIDLVRLTAALRPEGINWPVGDDGHKSFKLEELTKANELEHGAAHDALSDVRATIALAKLIKTRQPRVYDYVFNNRGKREVAGLLNIYRKEAVVHVSGMFGADRNCLAVVMPLAEHPTNRNGVIVYDLSVDPEPLISLSVEAIQQRLFTPVSELADNVERIPLKVIHINKCPVIAPLKVLKRNDLERLNLNLCLFEKHRQMLLEPNGVAAKLQQVFTASGTQKTDDPDLMLYSGGFFSPMDRECMNRIIKTPPEQLVAVDFSFIDKRLDEMLFRYRARNYPECLDAEDMMRWKQFCNDRLLKSVDGHFGIEAFMSELLHSRERFQGNEDKQKLLDQLETFVKEVVKR